MTGSDPYTGQSPGAVLGEKLRAQGKRGEGRGVWEPPRLHTDLLELGSISQSSRIICLEAPKLHPSVNIQAPLGPTLPTLSYGKLLHPVSRRLAQSSIQDASTDNGKKDGD